MPEVTTAWLAGFLDLLRLGTLLGGSIRSVLSLPVLNRATAAEYEAAQDAGDVDERDETVSLRYGANLMWQMLGWAWFVAACILTALTLLLGNSPIRHGFAAYVVFPIGMLAAAISVGNWVVCLGIGRGRSLYQRRGARNTMWAVVAGTWWAFWMIVDWSLLSPA